MRIWTLYLDAKADRKVNLPDHIMARLKKGIVDDQNCPASLFDDAIRDVLNLMTDNIYPVYVKAKEAKRSKASAPTAAKPQPTTNSGGCCVLM